MGKRDEGPGTAALVKSAAVGGGVAVFLALLLAAILAAAALAGALPESALYAAAVAAMAVAAFGGGLTAAKRAGGKRLPAALGAAAILGLAAFLGKTTFPAEDGNAAPVLIAIIGGSVISGLLASKRKKRRH